jgi:hypothetical protein
MMHVHAGQPHLNRTKRDNLLRLVALARVGTHANDSVAPQSGTAPVAAKEPHLKPGLY